MIYFTIKQPIKYRQFTLEDLLSGKDLYPVASNKYQTNTRTFELESPMVKMNGLYDIGELINKLEEFNEKYEELMSMERSSLYETFHIPKRKGGFRRIDAPNDKLKDALTELKDIFENDFGVLYHTSAFAYVKKRSTIDAAKKHQMNESKWFGKYDLKDFFGSTTIDFVLKQLRTIYPFSEVMKIDAGVNELTKALDLAFLNGGLPQGTPFSPLITNVIMIPIDFKLFNILRSFNKQTFVYTRYADDFIISSKYEFDVKSVESLISNILKDFEAPFNIKPEKTRYGSSAGSNWILGVMLNKDNEITVGHKKKKHLQTMLSNYVLDKKNGKSWSREDIQVMEGYRSYYKMVEKETIDRIVDYINKKFDVNVIKMIKEDLRAC